MSADTPQNFANHARMVPAFHYVASPLGLIYVVWSLYRVATLRDSNSVYSLVGALALFGALAFSRLFALKAQDRVIRLEEQLRLARVLPADLAARVHELRPRQLIALRFAGDSEVVELTRDVLAGSVTEPKQIKQRIKHWRADHFRV